jgi:hypothetical protein
MVASVHYKYRALTTCGKLPLSAPTSASAITTLLTPTPLCSLPLPTNKSKTTATSTMAPKATKAPKIEEDQIEHMVRVTRETARLDAKKKAALLGYALVELYGEAEAKVGYQLKFGKYNDRPLSEVEVRHHRNSLLENGFLQFQTETAIPIGVKASEIDTTALTKESGPQPGPLQFLQNQEGRKVIAFGGQHRLAAVLELKTYYEGKIEQLRRNVDDNITRMNKNDKNNELAVRYQNRANGIGEVLETVIERRNNQRWWKVIVYDLGE